MGDFLSSHLKALFFFSIPIFFCHRFALKIGFYRIDLDKKGIDISFTQVLGSFIVYFSTFLVLPGILFSLCSLTQRTLKWFSVIELFSLFCCFFFFGCFLLLLLFIVWDRFGRLQKDRSEE